MEKIILKVDGMSCSHCEAAVKKGLAAVDGVSQVSVDLKAKTVTVDFDPSKTNEQAMGLIIEDLGFDVMK